MTLLIGDEKDRAKRNQYWRMLRRANADFQSKIIPNTVGPDEISEGMFSYYLKQKYGIEIELIDGKITSNYYIVNEKKYILFLLKYGS